MKTLTLTDEQYEQAKHALPQEKSADTKCHGVCICILDKGFMYIGYLETDGEYFTIRKPLNIRSYTSGKGLLWHAANGSEDMTLDGYDGELKGICTAQYSELKHFIPTKESLWYS